MRGNDGKLYISKPSKRNVFSWRPVRNASAGKAPARRSRRSRKSPQASRAKNTRREISRAHHANPRSAAGVKLGGGVIDEDVVYMDDHICILRPDARAGALCLTRIHSSGIDCETGINKQHYGTAFRRNNIFFRAATRLNPGIVRQPVHWVDELAAYFEPSDLQPKRVRPDDGSFVSRLYPNEGMAVIRVDPYRTSIFYSERRMLLPNMGENMKPDLTYDDFLYNSTGYHKINNNLEHQHAEIVYPHGTMPSSWFVFCRVPDKHGPQGVGAAVPTRPKR